MAISFTCPHCGRQTNVAIYDLRKHPEKHGWGRAIFGLVMGLIFTLGMVAMLVAGVFGGRR